MSDSENNCPFCQIDENKYIAESESCFVIRDKYPVTLGHTLIIPKRHALTFFDLNEDEKLGIQKHTVDERSRILKEFKDVDGFNIGMNCGVAAGQTVMHCHTHLIPRRNNDIDDPRGGVRGVIPDKRIY